jgi:hypothetical protein
MYSFLQLTVFPTSPVRLAYQQPANSTFLSEQTSHQQSANSIFLSEQISTSHQPPAKRTGFRMEFLMRHKYCGNRPRRSVVKQ